MLIVMNEDKLYKTILMEVLSIEKELETLKEGVFFAPELYIGFRISKAIYKIKSAIFPDLEDVVWLRECDLKNGGPSDIVFKYGDNNFLVIELKLRNTIDSYEQDILKLGRLKDEDGIKYHKYFCALVDAFKDKEDGRLQYLISKYRLKDTRHSLFETKKYGYKNDIYCHLTLINVD